MKKIKALAFIAIGTVAWLLVNSCSHTHHVMLTTSPTDPPYNDFDQSSEVPKRAAIGAAVGVGVGTVVSPASAGVGALVGGAVGGTTSALRTLYEESPQNLMQLLRKEDVQVVQYGKMITLIVPTDKYYMHDSSELNDIEYMGLNHIAQLVLRDSKGRIYVAGFTDANIDLASRNPRLSEERARTMADFLWANGVPLDRLVIQGYADRYDVSDNYLIHGTAMNRRVEIQWETKCYPPFSQSDLCQNN